MKRLILSIAAGFVVTALLSTLTDHLFHMAGVYPPYGEPMFDNGLLLIAFAYRGVFTIFGSYVTAVLAREKAMKAVVILGTVGSILWLLGAIAMWEYAAPWYNIVGIISGIPLTWIGGKLYQIRASNVQHS